jgi:hypothetical protein
MRWGVRRYQNPDGTLTELGKKRYGASTDKKVQKEVKKDLEATNTILRETTNASRTASATIRNHKSKVQRMDLSKMTDAEMRQKIAREQLESQYDAMFNPKRQRVESGKQTVASVLEGLGTTTALVGSALSIAIAVKALRGK